MFNPGYHVFCALINGAWHRSAETLDEEAFDRVMDKFGWMLPYRLKVFHYNSKEGLPITHNRVFLAMPVIPLDINELCEERIGVTWKRAGQEPVAVRRYCDGFVIADTNDGYGRLLHCSESDELAFEELYPIPFAQARVFVDKYHRHCEAPQSHKFSIGLLERGRLVGVIIASTPKARALDNRFTLELNRCCVLPDQRNACSKLYAKAIQAGKSMGYRRFITYTLPEESGSSLRAVGFKADGFTGVRPRGWNHPSRPRKMPERYPTGRKQRWVLYT